MNRAVFLDRDGVINKIRPYSGIIGDPANYILSWEDFEFIDGAIDGMRMIANAGYRIIVVSNQSCIGKGLTFKETIKGIFCRMTDITGVRTGERYLSSKNLVINGSYWCPHTPEDHCACRKPKPGMIYQAAIEHEIDLSQSWMVGDNRSDGDAASNAGIFAKHIIAIADKGWFVKRIHGSVRYETLYAPNLLEAAKIITGG